MGAESGVGDNEMTNREQRKRKGEIREDIGIAIINPYGGLWSEHLFDAPEKARQYLNENFPRGDSKKFKLAMAVRTIEIYRPLSEIDFIPMPE